MWIDNMDGALVGLGAIAAVILPRMLYRISQNNNANRELREQTGLSQAELNEKLRQIQAGEMLASALLNEPGKSKQKPQHPATRGIQEPRDQAS